MAERRDYDALAQDINLKDITSCEKNANILRILRDGDPDWDKHLYIMNEADEDDGFKGDFVVGEGDDLGWLGYFVGKCEVIETLHISYFLPDGEDNYFFDVMNQNRSLTTLTICDEISAGSWISLGNFLENNRNLSHFEVRDQHYNESAQNLASALGRMNHNFLTDLHICGTGIGIGIGDEGFTEIAAVLGSQPQLERLNLVNNNIGRDGCVALGNMLSSWPHSNKLEALYIDNNAIDDGGLQVLVSGLMNCCSLKHLYLGGNRSITATGLRSLFPLLQSERHSLETLCFYHTNLGDDGAIALAEGLSGNKSLKELLLSPSTSGITAIGWSAFSKLLCDTSTVNNTYLSHHTLRKIGCYYGQGDEGVPDEIQRLLTTNRYQLFQIIQGAAICKILKSHPDLDMEPFFTMKMQFLPVVMSWFERVEPIEEQLINSELINESERSCQSRKLSALYKFVRGMPDLAIIGYWEGRMIRIEAKKRKLADEIRRLHDEVRRLNDEERRLEYEEKFTLERLGDRPMGEAEVNRHKRMRHE